ncbi:hypothetical protein AX13_00020 [Comamonas aquatica DA1877]|uniref:Uncharacterized protein n=1 Tax=Comamonas aquatica DA1877 TaxID=1457173 RepID=A0A014MV68_9BURK|nr:hypothetical protein AX13_00020 [Comamonas aquatica DA1877]
MAMMKIQNGQKKVEFLFSSILHLMIIILDGDYRTRLKICGKP